MPLIVVSSLECAAPVNAILGEGPIWDPRSKKLVFLDIKGDKIFSFDPDSRQTRQYAATGMVSALGLAQNGAFICASKNGFARLSLEDASATIEPVVDPEKHLPGNRFNDGKVDPAGGFWAGTMDNAEQDATAGSWWRLTPDGGATLMDAAYHVTNGPAFDPQNERVYLTDSAAQEIFVADTDGAEIRNKRRFLKFKEADGYPDGMDVDSKGFLWVAFWDGGVVRRFSPEGELAQTIPIAAPRPTSVKLVCDTLYVTTARIGLSAEQLAEFPNSGGLFMASLSEPLGAADAFFGRD